MDNNMEKLMEKQMKWQKITAILLAILVAALLFAGLYVGQAVNELTGALDSKSSRMVLGFLEKIHEKYATTIIIATTIPEKMPTLLAVFCALSSFLNSLFKAGVIHPSTRFTIGFKRNANTNP